MSVHPLRLVVVSYAAALAGAVGSAALGAGWVAALLIFWLGGAALALALPLTPRLGRAFRRDAAHDAAAQARADALLAEALQRWDADAQADAVDSRPQDGVRASGATGATAR